LGGLCPRPLLRRLWMHGNCSVKFEMWFLRYASGQTYTLVAILRSLEEIITTHSRTNAAVLQQKNSNCCFATA